MNSPPQSIEPAGLYIHIPFCEKKCGYCSFASRPVAGQDVTGYLAALSHHAEMMAANPWVAGQTFATLFIGGGTPSIYEAAALAGLIKRCRSLFPFSPEPEITIEANPNTLTLEKLATLHRAGVNRLSIGVQSFNDSLLQRLGRTHSAALARATVDMARRAGFTSINLDLIYGLPNQDLAAWRHSLETALSLAPEHLALYELMVETNTPFHRQQQQGALELPDEDTVCAMAELAQEYLPANGLRRYEVSNYSRPGYECRHNINYWRNGSYIGLGAAAVSCLDGLRIQNLREPAAYTQAVTANESPLLEAEGLSRDSAFRETVIMGLRMMDGVSMTDLNQRHGIDPRKYYAGTLPRLLEQGLIEIDEDRLRLTAWGMNLANQILAQLV